MLNFIYYPVSFILWVWHKVFGYVLGESSGAAWALAVVFLVFTLRALLYKPFVSQVRSMRKMAKFQPEMAKLKAKYGKDKQKLAAEMQKLQSQEGFNPLGGCLPVLVQVPVFIGLFQVLKEFKPGNTQNYFFDAAGVRSFVEADFFGAKLGAWVWQGQEYLHSIGTSLTHMWIVMVPLMIAAGVFTHITARQSVARQTEAQAANPQAAIMNKLLLYVFPIGVVVGAPFLPLAVLLYWVSNNLWTLGQQYVVYKRIEAEEEAQKTTATEVAQARAPRPGQKPIRPERVVDRTESSKTPGAKPVARKPATQSKNGSSAAAKPAVPANGTTVARNGAGNGVAGGNGSAKADPAAKNGAVAGSSGSSTPHQPARRGKKRR